MNPLPPRAALTLALLLLCVPSSRAVEPVPREPQPQHLEFRERLAQRTAQRLERYRVEHADELLSTPEAVLERHVEATGGRDAWEAIQTLEIRGRILDTSAEDLVLLRQYRRPLGFRQGMEGAASATVTDGAGIWRVGPDGWKKIEMAGFAHLASMDDHMLDPAATGIRHEFVGVEMINHAPVYHLRRSYADGTVEELYFHVESGLLVERFTDYLSGPSWFSYWDYRDVGGIRIPHVQIRSVNELGPPHGFGILGVTVDPVLPDSLFVPPPGN